MAKRGYSRHLRSRSADRRGGQDRHDDGLDYSPGTMAALARRYVEHLETLNLSERTFNGRRDELRLFLQWAQERDLTRPEQVTRSILEAYQRHLFTYRKRNEKPLSVTTQRSRLNCVRYYFSWLCRQRVLEANPASEIVLPKQPRKLPPEPLSLAQIDALLAVPDLADPLGLRDRAILELFYSTGIRRTELCRLDVAHVDREKAVVYVREGKGKKDRVVPLGSRALLHLENYLDRARPRLEVRLDQPALFLTSYGEPFNPDVLGRIVGEYLKRAGIERKGRCHLLRHSCATHMLDGGADVRHVQELLGHAKLETTAIYTHVSIEQLKAVHARCHPAERKR